MIVVRIYSLVAAEGQGDALGDCLRRLAGVVRTLEGCEETMVLRHLDDASRYVFTESWADAAAHAASGVHMPKPLLAEMTGLLAGKPQVTTLSPTSVG